MGDLIIRPFRPDDIIICPNRDGTQGLTHEMARVQATAGPAFSFVKDGDVVGVVGMVMHWQGMGTAWMILGDGINGHGAWITKRSKAMLDDVERAYNLHRVEALALAESERNQLWLEALGFTRERNGVAEAYTADQRPMVRYERIRKNGT